MTLPWMAAKIVLRPAAELRPHAGNARAHSVEQLDQIKASMLAFGFTNPLLVDEDGVLIATAVVATVVGVGIACQNGCGGGGYSPSYASSAS